MKPDTINLHVNGRQRCITRDNRLLLVEAIRDELNLKASRVGCLNGDCGACSILMAGEVRKSCLILAVAAEGHDIVTLEGETSPVMEALREEFINNNAFQCGFCTSGMLLVALDLLRRNNKPTEEQTRHAISGNLCRCTGYAPIISSIQNVAARNK